MRPFATGMFCIALALSGTACSVNILSVFANKTSNEALFEDAQTAINAGDYNGALAKIGLMTGSFTSTARVLELKASAQAGLCGFQFLPFVTAMGNMGATLLFPFLLKTFDAGALTNVDNCIAAQNTIESIGPMALRSTDENFFLAMIAFAKIGNILSFYTDVGQTGSVSGNGYDPCAVGGARTAGQPMTDADAREVGTGISLAVSNLAAVASQVNLGSGSLASINSVCSALPAGTDFCAVTDPVALTPNEVLGIRTLIKESVVVGLGTNCAGDVITCHCP